jgi:hypothetical protein
MWKGRIRIAPPKGAWDILLWWPQRCRWPCLSIESGLSIREIYRKIMALSIRQYVTFLVSVYFSL